VSISSSPSVASGRGVLSAADGELSLGGRPCVAREPASEPLPGAGDSLEWAWEQAPCLWRSRGVRLRSGAGRESWFFESHL